MPAHDNSISGLNKKKIKRLVREKAQQEGRDAALQLLQDWNAAQGVRACNESLIAIGRDGVPWFHGNCRSRYCLMCGNYFLWEKRQYLHLATWLIADSSDHRYAVTITDRSQEDTDLKEFSGRVRKAIRCLKKQADEYGEVFKHVGMSSKGLKFQERWHYHVFMSGLVLLEPAPTKRPARLMSPLVEQLEADYQLDILIEPPNDLDRCAKYLGTNLRSGIENTLYPKGFQPIIKSRNMPALQGAKPNFLSVFGLRVFAHRPDSKQALYIPKRYVLMALCAGYELSIEINALSSEITRFNEYLDQIRVGLARELVGLSDINFETALAHVYRKVKSKGAIHAAHSTMLESPKTRQVRLFTGEIGTIKKEKKEEKRTVVAHSMSSPQKDCRTCHQHKPATSQHFKPDTQAHDGLHGECRRCIKRRRDRIYDHTRIGTPYRKKQTAAGSANANARKAGRPPHEKLTTKDILALYESQCMSGVLRCAYSLMPLSESEWELDHIVPLSQGGTNTPNNVCIISPELNRLKAARTLKELAMVKAQEGKRLPITPPDMMVQQTLPLCFDMDTATSHAA